MEGMNRVVLMGHLQENPEPSETKTGKKVATFIVETNEIYKNADGEKVKRTDGHTITCWGKVAEACIKMLRKGSFVLVEGKIRNISNENGNKKNYSIFATEVSFISNYGSEK